MSGNATALLLYAFTASGELPSGSMTPQVHYSGTRHRRHAPALTEPVLGFSLSSLSRVTSAMESRVSFMACPSLQHLAGRDTSQVPAVTDIVPCDPPPDGLESSGPLGCFTVAMMALQVSMLRRAASTPGIQRALIVETDMLWLGHPLAMYSRWRHHRFPLVWQSRAGASAAREGTHSAAGQHKPSSPVKTISLDACDVRISETLSPTLLPPRSPLMGVRLRPNAPVCLPLAVCGAAELALTPFTTQFPRTLADRAHPL